MPRLRRTPMAAAAPIEPTGQAELSHSLVPLVDPMAPAWPSHARRCLKHLPEPLEWATPVLDAEHPAQLHCTAEQARALVLWLHRLPSHEQLLVGCHARRPA